MDSDRTTPTRGDMMTSDTEDSPSSSSQASSSAAAVKKFQRKISFDDFQLSGEVVFRRAGVLVQARRQDRLHSGTLEITDTQQGTFITWDRDKEEETVVTGREKVMINDQGGVAMCVGSPPSADWAVIAEHLQEPTTPIGNNLLLDASASQPSVLVTIV